MTDRWARVAKWGHNLILFFFLFFKHRRGASESFIVPISRVCKKILKYFIKQTFKLQYCSFFFSPPGSVYTVAL